MDKSAIVDKWFPSQIYVGAVRNVAMEMLTNYEEQLPPPIAPVLSELTKPFTPVESSEEHEHKFKKTSEHWMHCKCGQNKRIEE